MNFSESKEIEKQLREQRKTHWVLRLVTPTRSEYRTMPKSNPDKKIFKFFPPDMLDGATVYVAGALSQLTQGRSVVAHPSIEWKPKRRS